MGLSIGNIRSTLGGIQVPRGLPEGGQPFVGFNSRAQAAGKERFVPKFLGQREDKLVTRVGFGPGTISTPIAAFQTIREGVVESSERIQSLRQEQQVRRSADRRERRDDLARLQRRRAEFRIPEPSRQARNFVNAINETASFTQARLEGQEIPAGPGRASFQVNGQTFTFAVPRRRDPNEVDARDEQRPPRFDVTV